MNPLYAITVLALVLASVNAQRGRRLGANQGFGVGNSVQAQEESRKQLSAAEKEAVEKQALLDAAQKDAKVSINVNTLSRIFY